MSDKLNIVFMGTPPFAAHILEQLLSYEGCTISAVYCQPDRPAGRGKKLVAPAVKMLAEEKNIPVLQPVHFKEQSDKDALAAFAPDILVVAAYGLILPQAVLDIPRFAPINVHASLLPLYRGAAPIQRAIIDGHQVTGVSIMRMEAGLDSGPIYATKSMAIEEHTSDSLHGALADLGAQVLKEVLHQFTGQDAVPCQEQVHERMTHAPKMRKEDGLIKWHACAAQVHAQIRGVTSWPGAQARILRPEKEDCDVKLGPGRIGPQMACNGQNTLTTLNGYDSLTVHDDHDDQSEKKLPKAGEIWRLQDGSIAVATNDNWYILQSVRPNNKKEMTAEAFANGYFSKGFGYLATMQEV